MYDVRSTLNVYTQRSTHSPHSHRSNKNNNFDSKKNKIEKKNAKWC